jgi:hypothetical protein
MKKYQWASWALVLNAVGFVLLFVAFQGSSSDLSIYSKDENIALCYSGHIVFQANYKNGHSYIGVNTTDTSICLEGHPTAIVNTDHPWLGKLGVLCIFASFWMQFKSIDRTEANLTSSQIRALRNLGLFRN